MNKIQKEQGDKIDEESIEEYKKEFEKNKKGALQNLSEEKLNQTIDRVEEKIQNRMQEMEKKLCIESEGDNQ